MDKYLLNPRFVKHNDNYNYNDNINSSELRKEADFLGAFWGGFTLPYKLLLGAAHLTGSTVLPVAGWTGAHIIAPLAGFAAGVAAPIVGTGAAIAGTYKLYKAIKRHNLRRLSQKASAVSEAVSNLPSEMRDKFMQEVTRYIYTKHPDFHGLDPDKKQKIYMKALIDVGRRVGFNV